MRSFPILPYDETPYDGLNDFSTEVVNRFFQSHHPGEFPRFLEECKVEFNKLLEKKRIEFEQASKDLKNFIVQ